jgi:hypothetical protein
LTTFAPFHKEHKCVVIAYEKEFCRRNLDESDPTSDTQADIEGFRIVKILMGWEDEQMLALGTKSGNDVILLLELSVQQSSERVVVRKLAKLFDLHHGDDFTAMVSKEQPGQRQNEDDANKEEKHILIAALVAASRQAIYRVECPR